MSTWGVLSAGNHWTALENSQFNAWYVNFGSGNTNTTNKYNSYRVRPVAALDIKIAEGWVQAFEECARIRWPPYSAISTGSVQRMTSLY